MRHLLLMVFVLAIGEFVASCSSDGVSGSSPGQEGQSCYPNGTCNAGLTCASHLCVQLPDGSTSGGAGGSGTGGSGTGGSATGGAKTGSGGAGATDSGTIDGNHDGGDGVLADGGKGADGATATCSAIAQTGCAAGQKCTWVQDQDTPTVTGEVRCVPNGTVDLAGSCTYGPSGPTTGYDMCKKGLVCVGGTCRTICDSSALFGTAGACDALRACDSYSGLFANDNTPPAAGVCDPTCDPLTQRRLTDNAANCGGTIDNAQSPPQPSKGCYGTPSTSSEPTKFLCAQAGKASRTSDFPCTSSSGCASTNSPYLNGCAPGFLPLLHESTGSPTVICVALCEPGNTSSAAIDNATGKVGSSHTCPLQGAGGSHECRFWWSQEGAKAPISSSSNGLGICYDYTKYMYDSNGDLTPDTPEPSCTTLSNTAHTFSQTMTDTQYWGCESVAVRPR